MQQSVQERSTERRIPGRQLLRGTKIQCRYLFLVYRGIHINKSECTRWMTHDVFDSEFGIQVEAMRVSHRSGPTEHESDRYTYVIVCLFEALKTCKTRIFNWEDIRPDIRVLKNDSQVQEVAIYLETWTPPMDRTVDPPADRITIEVEKNEPKMDYKEATRVQTDEDYRSWVAELRYIASSDSKSPEIGGRARRPISSICCSKKQASLFFKRINSLGPRQTCRIVLLLIDGFPSVADIEVEADKAREKYNKTKGTDNEQGWSGKAIVFKIAREEATAEGEEEVPEEAPDSDAYEILECLSDKYDCSIWLLTTKIPSATYETMCTYRTYQVREEPGEDAPEEHLYLLHPKTHYKLLFEQVMSSQ